MMVTCVPKSCAYLTRNGCEQLLVFRGPEHDALQIPKGTIAPGESPREAMYREIKEESGIDSLGSVRHVASDVWTRRQRPLRLYVRYFFHVDIDEPRNHWSHVVSGDGAESGQTFEFFWVDLPTDERFALSLDDYLGRLRDAGSS